MGAWNTHLKQIRSITNTGQRFFWKVGSTFSLLVMKEVRPFIVTVMEGMGKWMDGKLISIDGDVFTIFSISFAIINFRNSISKQKKLWF